jgi:hypothetical protein
MWSHEFTFTRTETNEEIFHACYFISKIIIVRQFTGEISTVDDRSATNRFGFPLMMLLTVDMNQNSPLVAFAILTHRTTEAYTDVVEKIAQTLGIIPQVAAGDRSLAQMPVVTQVLEPLQDILLA